MMDIVQEARNYAVSELEKYGSPLSLHFEISEKKGVGLAEKLSADITIVSLGVYFMDLKLGEALKKDRLKEHIQMSVEAAKEFFITQPFGENPERKVINCIEAHHGEIPFLCPEAEICANADCYRFLHPKGFFAYLALLGGRGNQFADCFRFAEEKLEEKHRILSLDICKQELEPHYIALKKLIAAAREL